MENLLKQSFIDLQEDFKELFYLYNDYLKKLSLFKKEIENKKSHINFYTETKISTNTFISELNSSIKQIEKIIVKTNSYKTQKDLDFLQNEKLKYFNFLRSKVGLYAALITSTDWQSPSFNHSLYSLAGRQTGKINHTISDYKRDIHLDEKPYEKIFLKEYIDARIKFNVYTYLVNSGMTAFITVLNFLITEKKIKEKILIGKSIYFQNKEVIKKFFPEKIIEVDENNYENMIKAIRQNNPSVIIFDTISNSFDLAMPNINKLIEHLIKNINHDVYLIIDNTNLPIFSQPLKLIKGKNKHLNLIVLESLNKYHQFGLDKVTAGIITAYGKDTIELYYSRQNSGTNILDSSVYILPTPNQFFLEKRLLRFERNIIFLTQALQDFIDQNPKTIINKIIYPGLSIHPSSEWNQNIKFHGSYFSLEFKNKNPKTYKKFINKFVTLAKKENIQISVGTSFGFNNTRIYLTALRSDFTIPFVRISVGTENIIEIEKIKNILIKTISTF